MIEGWTLPRIDTAENHLVPLFSKVMQGHSCVETARPPEAGSEPRLSDS